MAPMSAAQDRPGVLFIDVLIGLAVFGVIVSGVVYALLFSQQGMLEGGDRIRSVYMNNRAVEAVRAVRDAGFSSITEGAYGVALGSGGTWVLVASGTTTPDGFTTTVTITEEASDRFSVRTHTSWDLGIDRTGSSVVVTDITDWRSAQSIGDWSNLSLDGSYTDEGTPVFRNTAVNSSYAFVTSEVTDGDGLYVFDISDTTSPTRVASSFNLGYDGYDIVLVGNALFVVTTDPSQEIRVYDVESPTSLSAASLSGSINVPGNAKARSIEYYDGTLFIAMAEDSSESEFFAYDVQDISSMTLLDDLNDPGSTFGDLSIHNAYAYLADTMDTSELRVIDIFDEEDLQLAPGEGYNASDTVDALSIATVGDYALLGRALGSVTDEVHLFDISESPVPSAAPWNYNAGGAVNGIDTDPSGTYAFLATEQALQELIVLDIATFAGGGSPVADTYDTSTGVGKGVLYSATHDRAFLTTNTAFIILKPGT